MGMYLTTQIKLKAVSNLDEFIVKKTLLTKYLASILFKLPDRKTLHPFKNKTFFCDKNSNSFFNNDIFEI